MSTLSKKLLTVLNLDSGGELPQQRHLTKLDSVYIDAKKNTPLLFQNKSKSTELVGVK
jgi:hypothetical protein